jgi:8-oxo-dGTP pyrophosphatase MutT (NUDIX family)
MYDEFVKRLSYRLSAPLPGEEAQYRMAPAHRPRPSRDPSALAGYRQSSVLVLLYNDNGVLKTVLLKRHDYQGVHSGQVGFPGGKQEPGETLEATALREANEEIGIEPGSVQILGQLTRLFIPVSRFIVQPFVAVAPVKPVFIPDPYEVQQVIEVDVESLIGNALIRSGMITHSDGLRIATPYYEVQGFTVWGATAMIISELSVVLQETGLGR